MSLKENDKFDEALEEMRQEKKQPKTVPYRYHTIHSGKFEALTQSEHDLFDEVREDRI